MLSWNQRHRLLQLTSCIPLNCGPKLGDDQGPLPLAYSSSRHMGGSKNLRGPKMHPSRITIQRHSSSKQIVKLRVRYEVGVIQAQGTYFGFSTEDTTRRGRYGCCG